MKAFISHNRADKEQARTLASLLVEQGEGVWFDEWAIRPGESLTGGMEEGLASADVFILLWSEHAQRSTWVGAEVRATIRRRVDHEGLRIVPLMLDATPLPALVADYRGFDLSDGAMTMADVAVEVAGRPRDVEVARRLQSRLKELAAANVDPRDPFGILICPTAARTASSARRSQIRARTNSTSSSDVHAAGRTGHNSGIPRRRLERSTAPSVNARASRSRCPHIAAAPSASSVGRADKIRRIPAADGREDRVSLDVDR